MSYRPGQNYLSGINEYFQNYGGGSQSLYRTSVLISSRSGKGNNSLNAAIGHFRLGEMYALNMPWNTNVYVGHYEPYKWNPISSHLEYWVDITNKYCEPTTDPNSYPGARYLANIQNNVVNTYTTFYTFEQGPWSAWNWGAWYSGLRFLTNTIIYGYFPNKPAFGYAWGFECWVRPIYNSAGTNNPAAGGRYSAFVYPCPIIINPIQYNGAWNGGYGDGGFSGFGLWVDQYKICLIERGSDFVSCRVNISYTFDTSKFYQIVVTCRSRDFYKVWVNGQLISTIYNSTWAMIPVLDMSELLCGNPYNWGGINPFFVGWSSQFRAWSRELVDNDVRQLYSFNAVRYGLPPVPGGGNPGSVCAWSNLYNFWTTQYIYADGSVVDSGLECAPRP
jgi:hypothetical protein